MTTSSSVLSVAILPSTSGHVPPFISTFLSSPTSPSSSTPSFRGSEEIPFSLHFLACFLGIFPRVPSELCGVLFDLELNHRWASRYGRLLQFRDFLWRQGDWEYQRQRTWWPRPRRDYVWRFRSSNQVQRFLQVCINVLSTRK